MRISDWSSDVCSSDLLWRGRGQYAQRAHLGHAPDLADLNAEAVLEGFSHRARHRRSADHDLTKRARSLGRPLQMIQVHRPDRRNTAGKRDLLFLDQLLQAGAIEPIGRQHDLRSEEHTSELQSLMRTSYAVF